MEPDCPGWRMPGWAGGREWAVLLQPNSSLDCSGASPGHQHHLGAQVYTSTYSLAHAHSPIHTHKDTHVHMHTHIHTDVHRLTQYCNTVTHSSIHTHTRAQICTHSSIHIQSCRHASTCICSFTQLPLLFRLLHSYTHIPDQIDATPGLTLCYSSSLRTSSTLPLLL